MRRAPSVDALIPALYLKGISTGDFTEGLEAILGEGASGLSATNVVRLKTVGKPTTRHGASGTDRRREQDIEVGLLSGSTGCFVNKVQIHTAAPPCVNTRVDKPRAHPLEAWQGRTGRPGGQCTMRCAAFSVRRGTFCRWPTAHDRSMT
jgi:hypothetical protein